MNINFSLFYKLNLFLTILLGSLFLQYNTGYDFFTFNLVLFGLISSVTIFYSVLYLVLYFLTYAKNYILYISAIIFVSVDLALILDLLIFKLYKFHINAMVLNILLSPDAMNSIQLGIFPFLALTILILVFIGFEIYIIKRLIVLENEKKFLLNKKLNKIIITPLILIVLSEKISYGFSSLLNKNDVLAKFGVIPLYQPLTFNRVAAKYFDYKPEVDVKNTIQFKGTLNYPLKKLEIKENPNKLNIFIIASDSVKNSIINPDISPNIAQFKKESLVFNNHYSGGNATRFGIFSLIYGMNSTYWFSFLNSAKGPVLFDVLTKLNYDINIVSSTNTNWPEFRKTCYVNIQESIKDDFDGTPWKKDQQSCKYLIDKIDDYNTTKPIFSFIFFDSPHGFSYPKNFNKFNAVGENINYLTATQESDEIKNALSRYKNSVAYNDKLFKDIIDKLKQNNLYDNSLIIFTADHGQEFYEYGYFGHNSSFSKAQTNVPFMVKLPKNMKDIKINLDKLTSHNDIVPTILSMIGVTNNSGDYSNGYNLFDTNFNRDYVFNANWNNNAIITDKFTYVFSNMPNKMFKNEIRDTQTYKKLQDGTIDSKKVLDVMNENKKFLK